MFCPVGGFMNMPWFHNLKVIHEQQKETDCFKNKTFSKSFKCFWNACKKLLEKNSYSEAVARRCFLKKLFIIVSQISWGNTCASVSSQISQQLWKKRIRHSSFLCEIFKNTLFTEHLLATAFEYRNNMPRAFEVKWRMRANYLPLHFNGLNLYVTDL